MWWDKYKVDVPEGSLDNVVVERFSLDEEASAWTRIGSDGHRSIPAGTYTRLVVDKHTWMSDTPAEIRDHLEVIFKLQELSTDRVLINGLGLGVVLKAALACNHIAHIDVVERDKRVIELVGPTYTVDRRVTIHQADAIDKTADWPSNTRWDVVWHDIWLEISEDNKPDMSTLHRSYGPRTTWQGSWSKEDLKRQAKREWMLNKRIKELRG